MVDYQMLLEARNLYYLFNRIDERGKIIVESDLRFTFQQLVKSSDQGIDVPARLRY